MNGRRQRGVALISVLFVVVILTLLVSQVLTQGRHNLERTRWLQNQAQAYQYAVGGEQMARQMLYADYLLLKSEQLEYSPIPGPARRFRPDGGDILLSLEDLQGRVNLNNLHGEYADIVKRYLEDVVPQPALLPRLVDWTDGDTRPRPGGMEDDGFLNEATPFRAANRPLVHPSELAILRDRDGESMAKPTPLATVLTRPTPLNINTLNPELAALIHPRLSASQLESIQATTPFRSIQEVLQSDLTAGLALNSALLTVQSWFYQANVHARFHDWDQPLISRIAFDPVSGNITLIDRQLVITGSGPHQNLFDEEAQDAADLAL